MKRICCWLSLIGVLVACCHDLQAQETAGQQRRQLVEGLLRTLIDTQLSPRENAPAKQPRPKAQLDRTTTPKIREASQLLAAATQEMSLLVGTLQADLQLAPAVRSLLGQALQLNANATVLSRQLSRAWKTDELADELRNLDRDWRLLEHRLSQVDNLSRESRGHVQKVRKYEQRLCELFEVPPQVDRSELGRHASSLVGELRHLLEDIRLAVSDTQRAGSLLLQGQRVEQRARRFAETIESAASYQSLRSEYEAFEQAWNKLTPGLRPVTDRYVQRQVQRIQAADRNIHDLLWLPSDVDRDDLLHMSSLLRRDVDQLLDRVTLRMLTDLPAARNLAVASASDFEVACSDFAECVIAGDDAATLAELYHYVYDEWQRLSAALNGLESGQPRQSVQDIERSIAQLREQLGVRTALYRQRAIRVAAAVTGLAQHLRTDVQQYFGRPNRYSRQFQTEALQAAADFHRSARKLHAGLVNGEKLKQVRSQSESVSAGWENVTRYVPRFSLTEQHRLNDLRRQVTPLVVEMQTMFSL